MKDSGGEKFRKISSRIWNDKKFRDLSNEAKLLVFFLLSHPHMTSLGGMRATVGGMAQELGWTIPAFRKAFDEILCRDLESLELSDENKQLVLEGILEEDDDRFGMVEYDEEACCLILKNFMKYNKPTSINTVKGYAWAIDSIPECFIKDMLIHRINVLMKSFPAFQQYLPKSITEPFEKTKLLAKALPKPLPKPLAKALVNHTEKENEKETEKEKTKNNVEQARRYAEKANEIFEFWKKEHDHEQAKFNTKRRTAVLARLKEGYEIDQIKKAILGIKKSPHHMGQNDRDTVYDDLELICRDGARLEKFIELEKEAKIGSSRKNSKKVKAQQGFSTIDEFVIEQKIAENRRTIKEISESNAQSTESENGNEA